MATHLQIFVYGSLKRGFDNHERLCQGFLSCQEATMAGELHERPSGYPVVIIPKSQALAVGSADPWSDARLPASLRLDATSAAHEEDIASRVHGEILTFDDPEARLPALDGLEGFRPGEGSTYQRVVAVVLTAEDGAVPVWVYVMHAVGTDHRRLPHGRWPEK